MDLGDPVREHEVSPDVEPVPAEPSRERDPEPVEEPVEA